MRTKRKLKIPDTNPKVLENNAQDNPKSIQPSNLKGNFPNIKPSGNFKNCLV